MKYFKNIELAKLYHVSEKSVRNWIQAAKESRLDLELYSENGRDYVANTTRNNMVVEQLVEKGKKYKNTRGFKKIYPKKEFYETYNNKQILDIISSITIHREIPIQYSYFDGGAIAWDEYANRMANEVAPNILNQSVELLGVTSSYLDGMFADKTIVNVVDVGPGNGLPVRATLERLLNQGKLGRYIAIDISQDMIDILERNIKKWFGEKIKPESYVRDITYERFDDILANEQAPEKVANMAFLLGATLPNFRAPSQVLQTINNSLGLDDILLISGYLDTEKTRRYFDFPSKEGKLPVRSGLILGFLNVDESLYEAELSFRDDMRARTISARLKVDISIVFDLPNGMRTVELHKDDVLLLWGHRHSGFVDLINFMDSSEFDLIEGIKSKDQEYFLLASKIKKANSPNGL